MFQKVWKDPVWSKVISVGILGLITIIWKSISPEQFRQIMHSNIPLWFLLVIIAITVLLLTIPFKKKKVILYNYTETAKEHDARAYRILKESIDEYLIPWSKVANPKNDFQDMVTTALRETHESYLDIDTEFLNPKIEASSKRLSSIINKLHFFLRSYAKVNMNSGYMTLREPPDYLHLGITEEGLDVFKNDLSELWQSHDEFVRIFKIEQSK